MNQYLKLNFQGVNAICSVNITSNTWASLSSTQDLGEFSTTPERKKAAEIYECVFIKTVPISFNYFTKDTKCFQIKQNIRQI